MRTLTLFLIAALPALIFTGASEVAQAAKSQVGRWPYSYGGG